jgi:trans-aconitate 2-methyltransferase
MSYLFGDSDLAAIRLELVASVFREPSWAFLRDAVGSRPSGTADIAVAVDLGCGPGFTTQLVAEALECRQRQPQQQVVGLDSSRAFIEQARSFATPGVRFELHDVTALPLPVDAIDLLYSRLLLTHLPHPAELVTRWIDELQPGGLLLLEEPEHIHTEIPTFSTYLDIVAVMLRDQSTELYLGPALDRIDTAPKATRTFSRVVTHPVSNRHAAAMFAMNLPNWRDSAFVRSHYAPTEIDALHAELHDLGRGPEQESNITWGLRQIAFERVGS